MFAPTGEQIVLQPVNTKLTTATFPRIRSCANRCGTPSWSTSETFGKSICNCLGVSCCPNAGATQTATSTNAQRRTSELLMPGAALCSGFSGLDGEMRAAVYIQRKVRHVERNHVDACMRGD